MVSFRVLVPDLGTLVREAVPRVSTVVVRSAILRGSTVSAYRASYIVSRAVHHRPHHRLRSLSAALLSNRAISAHDVLPFSMFIRLYRITPPLVRLEPVPTPRDRGKSKLTLARSGERSGDWKDS